MCFVIWCRRLLKKNYCSLCPEDLQHRISLYADDVVIFLQPSANDIRLTLDILQLFGEASGLKINVQKSTVLPIHCMAQHLTTLQTHLPCQISKFPCTYLGVPLTIQTNQISGSAIY